MFVFGADYNLEIFCSCGGGSSSSAGSGTKLAHNGGRTDAGSLCRAATPPQARAAKLAGTCVRAAAVGAQPRAHARALDIAARKTTLPPT